MARESKIPLVAAQSVIKGISYDESLKLYNQMTPQQQAAADDAYVDNNMGYGMDAWKAYQAAESEQRAGI